jgi:hypothetical protein
MMNGTSNRVHVFRTARLLTAALVYGAVLGSGPTLARPFDGESRPPGLMEDSVSVSPAAATPDARRWHTFVLTSAQQFRPPPPPAAGSAQERAELTQVRSKAAARDNATLNTIQYWLAGSPNDRWNELVVSAIFKNGQNGNRGNRALGLLNVAAYDALVAAWDAKTTYQRPRPSQLDRAIVPVGAQPSSPAYPSEHAVVAGAAAAVLGYLFPNDAERYTALAEQAGQATVQAGLQFPSDVQAGLELGRNVAALVIARARADHADANFSGPMPSGPGIWTGQNPIDPMMGTWTPWLLKSADQFRPPPPPAYDSAQKKDELAELRAMAAARTPAQTEMANYWQFGAGGSRAFAVYNQLVARTIAQYRLDDDPLEAARVYALTSVAAMDASIACWDAKYAYWAMRPSQLDPELKTVFPNPNHPSYPSAHSCITGAVMDVLGHLFPSEAPALTEMAQQASEARLLAGIHFRSDIAAGLQLGHHVAGLVNAWADQEGPRAALNPASH